MFDAISKGKELAFKELILDMIKAQDNLSLTEFIDYVIDKPIQVSGLQRRVIRG